MRTSVKPRVEAERWVKRAPSEQRSIDCRFDAHGKWSIQLRMPTHAVAAHGQSTDFHTAMAKAVRIALSVERRQKRFAKQRPAANKRTSRRARRTSRRAR